MVRSVSDIFSALCLRFSPCFRASVCPVPLFVALLLSLVVCAVLCLLCLKWFCHDVVVSCHDVLVWCFCVLWFVCHEHILFAQCMLPCITFPLWLWL